MDIAGIKIDVPQSAREIGISDEGRQLINWRYHWMMKAGVPGLTPQARNAYDDLSTWLRQVTERVGIPRESEFFLASWLLACNLLLILRQELMTSNHPRKEEGLYWFREIITRVELTGLWHLQFQEDMDAARIMGDTGEGE